MESDPPLMKLADEDDSLIQSFPDPTQTPSKSSLSYFTCSPLALPPSRTNSLKDSVHTEKSSSSSTEATNNKENINSNNVEMPKLGMGPIQMKRVKKGGDYNLRKSLAWDRAFFTDEGILDPRELNMITGINPYTCGRGLASISEEGNSSFSSSSRCRNKPNNMESSKEALLKELHDQSHTPKGNKVGNHDSLHHHKVAHKILSSDYTNRSGSKFGGCLEPSPASSLKRPNLNLSRTAKKESKIPKLPMSKSGSCFSAMTKGSMTARHNLIPKPPINVQKNIGSKVSLKEVHGSQSKPKPGLDNIRFPDKELAQKTVRNLTHSSSKATSSTKSQLVQLDTTNSGLEKIPDRFQSCEIQDESTPLTAKNLAQDTPTTSNNSLPSGLRLPSPSLRFFDQTTASESVSSQQKRIQQSNTDRCSKRQNATPRIPCGSTQLSLSSKGDKGVPRSNVYPDTVRKIQSECRDSDVELHKVIEQEKGILGHEGKMGMEKIALKGVEDEFVLHNEEEKLQNFTDNSVSTSGQSIQHQEQDILTKVDGSTDFKQDLAQMSEGISVNCIMPAVSSNLEEGPSATVSEINDYIFQEKSGSILPSSVFPEIRGQKQDGADVGLIHGPQFEEIQLKLEEVASLIDNHILKPEVELMNGTVSMGDDVISGTESVLQVAQCASTFSQSLEEEGLDIAPATIEAEFKIVEENQKHQEMGIIIKNLSDRCDVYECNAKPSNPIVLEQSNSNVSANIFHMVQGNVVKFNGHDQPYEPQEFVGVMLSMGTYDFKRNKDATVLMKNTKKEDNLEDLAQTSREQADTKESNAFKVNPVSEVCVESHRGEIGKREDDVGARKWLSSDSEDNCFVLQHGNIGHENVAGKVVDEKSLLVEDDTIYLSDMVMEVPGQKEEGVDVGLIFEQPLEEVQMQFRDVASLIDDENQSMGDVILKTESVVQVAQCANIFPQKLEDGGVDIELAKIENECRINEEVEDEVLEEGKNEDASMLMKRSNNIKRQDKSLVIHPPNAVPFSDEWLAAIEAAGEEILTMKRGAVQHSPPDKSIPERNPWSPVKNKANQIGPYDCTKYTNAMQSDPH